MHNATVFLIPILFNLMPFNLEYYYNRAAVEGLMKRREIKKIQVPVGFASVPLYFRPRLNL